MPKSKFWCREPDSNRHTKIVPDFESGVSTNFTISALLNILHLWEPAPTDSPTGSPGSTMVAKGLDFCVRDGNRYNPPALGTGTQRCVKIKIEFRVEGFLDESSLTVA